MTFTAVQRKIKGARAASVAIGSGDGWSAPTAGNLLVFSANSDALVTLTGAGTFTNGPSVIDGNGTYVWWKIATGAETTITGTPSTNPDDIVLSACEYAGNTATPFDVQNSSTIAGTPGGVTTTSTSVTTTGVDDLILAFGCIHAANSTTANPVAPVWTGGLTNVLSTFSQAATFTSATQACHTFVGELLASGAAGAHAQAVSWEPALGYSDRQELVIAFKAAAGAAAGELVIPRRPSRGLIMR